MSTGACATARLDSAAAASAVIQREMVTYLIESPPLDCVGRQGLSDHGCGLMIPLDLAPHLRRTVEKMRGGARPAEPHFVAVLQTGAPGDPHGQRLVADVACEQRIGAQVLDRVDHSGDAVFAPQN